MTYLPQKAPPIPLSRKQAEFPTLLESRGFKACTALR